MPAPPQALGAAPAHAGAILFSPGGTQSVLSPRTTGQLEADAHACLSRTPISWLPEAHFPFPANSEAALRAPQLTIFNQPQLVDRAQQQTQAAAGAGAQPPTFPAPLFARRAQAADQSAVAPARLKDAEAFSSSLSSLPTTTRVSTVPLATPPSRHPFDDISRAPVSPIG